jgi:2-dehydropantoate 2-reductase
MANVTVVGCGAIGGLAAFYMAKAGERVLFVDENPEHVQAIREKGLLANGVYGPMSIGPQRACTPDNISEPLEGLIFLACKSQHTPAAVQSLLSHMTAESCIVSLQNGMNEQIIGSIVGPERTMGALPDYGGAYLNPGVLEAVAEGTVYVGELDGRITKRAQEAARLLGIGRNKCELLTDIMGRIWTKLVFMSQSVMTALVDASWGEVLSQEKVRRLAALLIRESIQVSDAAGVKLHADPPWFVPSLYHPQTAAETQRLLRSYDDLIEFLERRRVAIGPANYQYIKKASGIHWDISYRKRKSEAPYLTVYCVAKGYRVPIPLNHRLIEMIETIEAGTRVQGWQNMDELAAYADTLGDALP